MASLSRGGGADWARPARPEETGGAPRTGAGRGPHPPARKGAVPTTGHREGGRERDERGRNSFGCAGRWLSGLREAALPFRGAC